MIGPLPYVGGKNRLAKRIISLLPEHTTYVEAFAGGAQVLFHKQPSPVEVLNDINFDIANFFRVCQWHYEELIRYLRFCLISRKLHEMHLATTLTPRKIEESFASPDTMSFWDLPGFIGLLEQSGFPAQRHRLHFNVLLARPFLLCAMVLVAATFSLRMQRRGGATLMIVGGVVSGFVLYFVSDIVFALGLSAKLPVALAAWTPTGVSLIFGASMLLHLEDG